MDNYLDLNKLLSGETDIIEFDHTVGVDFSDCDIRLCSDARFSGNVVNKGGYIELNAVIELDYEAVCSRCLAPIADRLSLNVNMPVAAELENEDTVDYILLEAGKIDIADFVYQTVVSAFPTKFLCRDDCKGLCPKCGKDLNLGDCGCKPEKDPRLAGLSDFFK